MSNLNLIKELVVIYGSTTVLSVAFNYFYHTRRSIKAFKESERNLLYKNLSTKTYLNLSELKKSMKLSNKIAMLFSTIPVLQVFYTINNITADPNYLNHYYNDKIEEINEQEVAVRKDLLRKIKKIKDVPNTIEKRLTDKEYLPSEEEYREVLNYSKSDVIVKHKHLTISKRKDDYK